MKRRPSEHMQSERAASGPDAFAKALAGHDARHRRAAHRLAWIRGWWVGAGALLALLAVDAFFGLPAAARLLLSLGWVTAVGTLGVATFRGLRRSRSVERMVARLIEQGNPTLDNRLVNALDFSERLSESVPHTSRSLMRAEIEAAGRALGNLDAAAALRPPTARVETRAALAMAAALALLGVAAPRVAWMTLPRFILPFGDYPPYSPTLIEVAPAGARVDYGEPLDIVIRTRGKRPASVSLVLATPDGARAATVPVHEIEEDTYLHRVEYATADMVYYATIPGGRSRRHRLTVVQIPRIDAEHVRYEYPPYTGLAPLTRPLLNDGIRAYLGTRVTLLLTSNRPLRGGAMDVGGRRVGMERTESANVAGGAFVIDSEQSIEAWVVDVDGLESRDRVRTAVGILPDGPPQVSIVQPGKNSFATPTATVPIEIEGRDDLGVRRLDLFHRLNESADSRKTVYDEPGAHRAVRATESLDLKGMGVRPGDVLEYHAAVLDSNPTAPSSAASPAYRLVIISEEEYAELVRARLSAQALRERYARLLRALEELADAQRQAIELTERVKEAVAAGEAGRERAQAAWRELRKAQSRLAEEARDLAGRLEREAGTPPIYDIESDYKELLSEFARRVSEAGDLMGQGAAAIDEAGREGADAAQALQSCAAAQQAALDRLSLAAGEYAGSIDKAGEDIEGLFELYRDVETFKSLLARQEAVQRRARFLDGKAELEFEDKALLKELTAEQRDVARGLTALKQALRDHAQPIRERYPRVADDAESIAARIEELALESTMETAAAALGRLDATEGFRAAKAAYEAMLSMVDMCSGARGGVGAACELRLRIQMGMELGATLEQLAQSLRFGMNDGVGGVGKGSDGVGGSIQSPFGLYGGSDTLADMFAESPAPGGGGGGRAQPTAFVSGAAPAVEVRRGMEKSEMKLELPGGEHILDEYRALIIEYFTRMAEQP